MMNDLDKYADLAADMASPDFLLRLVQEREGRSWRPIETAPKDNRERLHYVIITDGVCMPDVALWLPERPAYVDSAGGIWLAREAGWFNVSRSRIQNPTHWMPLPAPPVLSSLADQSS